MTPPLLSLLILAPLFAALILAFVPSAQKTAHRGISAAAATLVFLLSLPLITGFDASVGGFQRVEDIAWIPSIGAGWRLGIDGISLWIVLLTTFLTPLILIGAQRAIDDRVREFAIAMLVLESAMIGALCATDLLLFYLFWELMLVPMYLLIGIWGGTERLYATVKFVIYTVVGSLLMLVAIVYLYVAAGHTFDYAAVLNLDLSHPEQLWLFGAFGLAFAIKVPVFPFHTWLPDAHTQAPTAGSVVLAGVLLKMGTYGFLRFALPLFPHAMGAFSPLIAVLAVIGVFYGALVAWAQADVKKLVAYSSVSHLGFVMLGIVALNEQAVEGAVLQMINHGISTGALFMLVGMLYERRHTRAITDFGGLARSMPVFATLFCVVTMSSIGLPGTNGFIGEFMILSGAMASALPLSAEARVGDWPVLMATLTVVATTGVVFGAIYMLSMYRRVFFGPITNPDNEGLTDLTLRERLVLAPLIVAIFFIGFFPNTMLDPMHASVSAVVEATSESVCEARDPGRCGPVERAAVGSLPHLADAAPKAGD